MAKAKTNEPESKPEEMPALFRCGEFIESIKKKYPIESLGGFIFWMQSQGMPPKWPRKMWEDKLEEYLNRKL